MALPALQPIHQKRIWERFNGRDSAGKIAEVIDQLKKEDYRFHMEGGSWTTHIPWFRGCENVLGPMGKVSSRFHEKMLKKKIATSDLRYRTALFALLCSQVSDHRYWRNGIWTD